MDAKNMWLLVLYITSIVGITVLAILYNDVSNQLDAFKTLYEEHKITKRNVQRSVIQPSCIMRCQRGRKCMCYAAAPQPWDPPCRSDRPPTDGYGENRPPTTEGYLDRMYDEPVIARGRATIPTPPAVIASTSYVQWGSLRCPDDRFSVYRGFIAGPYVSKLQGGSADLQCVSSRLRGNASDAERSRVLTGNSSHPIIGAVQFDESTYARTSVDVACSLCYLSDKSDQIMIPGTSTCHDHWTLEYSGWLMSSARSTDEQYSTISNQICVARSMETFSAPTNNSTIKLSHVKLDINNIILRTPCVVCSR